ncbi:hypothetical protein ACF07Y_39250 [Streptomyces sp. NPDC016566]|uniref:hypothetical protein n=1 Tax=Streptomyces sp. NPDC016566 TaxID=3364967 RepID=UPI0036FF7B4D
MPGRKTVPAEPRCAARRPGARPARYLDYRNGRRPRTANAHLFLCLGMPARRLREDRLAEATGGDPRRICDLFGLTVGATLRYTATVDQAGLVEYTLRNAGPRPKTRIDDIG